MPAPYARAGFFRCAFSPLTSRHCALIFTLNQVQHHDRNNYRSRQRTDNGRSIFDWSAALPVLGIDVLVYSNAALRQHNNR
jgi:hypothetical protein